MIFIYVYKDKKITRWKNHKVDFHFLVFCRAGIKLCSINSICFRHKYLGGRKSDHLPFRLFLQSHTVIVMLFVMEAVCLSCISPWLSQDQSKAELRSDNISLLFKVFSLSSSSELVRASASSWDTWQALTAALLPTSLRHGWGSTINLNVLIY